MLVEEIALYHLDSLTKTRKDLQEVKYFVNGYVEPIKLLPYDTFCLGKQEQIFLKPRASDITVREDTTLTYLLIPKGLRRNGGKHTLMIYRHVKINNKYYVCFNNNQGISGYFIILQMDDKGNLLNYCVNSYIY